MRRMAQVIRLKPPRLLLHFDVNKTIVIADPVSGITMEKMVNSLLSECVWGSVDEKAKTWSCVSAEPSTSPPASSSASASTTMTMTYGRFLETVAHPYTADQRSNEAIKVLRKSLKTSFTHVDRPGHVRLRICVRIVCVCLFVVLPSFVQRFADHASRLLRALTLPSDVAQKVLLCVLCMVYCVAY